MSIRYLWVAAIVVALGSPSGAAVAQTKLKFAHVYETNEPYHTEAVWAAGEIAKRTNNKYQIDVFPASALGNEQQINQALPLGTIDLIYTGTSFAGATYKPLAISGAPGMIRDYAHWKAYRASTLFKELSEGYDKATGHQIVALTYYGARHVTANKAINKPEDMKNLKIRVPDAPLYTLFPRAVGANPTPIAFAEVYLALQNKTVDAQENPLPTIEAKKFYEVQSHINLTGHITDALLTIIGGPLWNKLSDADKKTFTEVYREAAARATAEIIESEKKLTGDFAKRGKTVVKVDRKPFIAAVQKYYQEGKQPDGNALPWPKDVYDKLQAIK